MPHKMFLFPVFPRFLSLVVFSNLVFLYQADIYQNLCEYLSVQYYPTVPVCDFEAARETHHLGCRILKPCSSVSLSLPHLQTADFHNVNKLLRGTDHLIQHQHNNFLNSDITIPVDSSDFKTHSSYTRDELLSFRPSKKSRLPQQTFNNIKSLGILQRERGRRGSHTKRKIPVIDCTVLLVLTWLMTRTCATSAQEHLLLYLSSLVMPELHVVRIQMIQVSICQLSSWRDMSDLTFLLQILLTLWFLISYSVNGWWSVLTDFLVVSRQSPCVQYT
jgi:hypothetical protein